jgi:hypothetical protein
MNRRNRGGPSDFPFEELDIASISEELVRDAYAWKWLDHKDPKRRPMQAFRVHAPELDARGEKKLAECGRLVQIRYRVPLSSNIKQNPQKSIAVPKEVQRRTYLMFDRADPQQRLFMIQDEASKKFFRDALYRPNPFQAAPIAKLAAEATGIQSDGWYPDVLAKPLGLASAVTYDTDKSVDGRSYYIHRFGEETGIRPVAAVSEDGTLWWCGGDYTCPTAGITN